MFDIAIFLVLLVCLALIGLLLFKIRRIHVATYELIDKTRDIHLETRHLYAQIQAFHELTALLKMAHPLPTLRGWAASPDFLLIVARHALKEAPKTIVECSCGASTIVLARCAQLNRAGHVFSLEHDPKFAAITRSNLIDAGLSEWATVLDAPLKEMNPHDERKWYSLDMMTDPGQIEMLVVDGPPTHINPCARYPAIPMLKDRLANRCHVFLDDADRSDEKETVRKWLQDAGDSSLTVDYPSAEKGCAHLIYDAS